MKKNSKKIKVGKLVSASEDENTVKNFVITVLILGLLITGIYVVTEVLKGKDELSTENTPVDINYDILTVGTLLNRPYDEYYVMVYNSEDSKSALYSTIMSNYMSKFNDKSYIKIYYCDLNNKLNEAYYNVNNDNKSNPKATRIEDLDFSELTLLKIEKGKIKNYIENIDDIKKLLK